MHGNGIIFSSEDKILYEGEYKNGKYDVEGKLWMESKNTYYIGGFEKGKKNGHGEIYDKNGTIIMEFYEDMTKGSFKLFKKNSSVFSILKMFNIQI